MRNLMVLRSRGLLHVRNSPVFRCIIENSLYPYYRIATFIVVTYSYYARDLPNSTLSFSESSD